MSPATFNMWTTILLSGATTALVLAILFLIAAIVGWRTPRRNRRLLLVAVCLGAFVTLPLIHRYIQWNIFLPSRGQQAAQERQERRNKATVVSVGEKAPPFQLVDTAGSEFDLDQHRGKVVLVNFFATWCGPCLLELPHIQKLWDTYRTHPEFTLLVIGREETSATVADFQHKHGFTFPMAADPDRTVYARYAHELIPRTFLVDRNGKICLASVGAEESELTNLETELARQLAPNRVD